MRNIDQQQQTTKTGATSSLATRTKYRDFNDFLGRKQADERKENGDEADRKPKVPYSSYKEFLENYNTKKFSSVRPVVPVEKKTMKSEIFIQVNEEERKIVAAPSPPSQQNGAAPPPPPFFNHKSDESWAAPPAPPPPPIYQGNNKFEKSTNHANPESGNKKMNFNEDSVPPVPEFLESLLRKRAASLQKTNEGEVNTMTYVPVVEETDRIDKNDPNVKKLVYNTYRGLLGAYNNKANDIISTLPRHCVREDRGIAKQLESIA